MVEGKVSRSSKKMIHQSVGSVSSDVKGGARFGCGGDGTKLKDGKREEFGEESEDARSRGRIHRVRR